MTNSQAHRRVGTAAVLAFLALLLLGASHRSAQADPAVPVTTPQAPGYAPPEQGFPRGDDGDGGFGRREHDGGGGFDGGPPPGGFDGGGAVPAPSQPAPAQPAPSTGGSQT